MGKTAQRRGKFKEAQSDQTFKKIALKKLMEYVKNYPDDYLRDIAVVFNCPDTAIRKALTKPRTGKRISETNEIYG